MKNISFLLLFWCLLGGCAPKLSSSALHATYYPQCVRPLQAMEIADSQVAKSTASSALAGALAGAIIGFAQTGDAAGALIGAGIGALGGTAIGYSYAKFYQISDENIRFASIRVTANQDLTNANRQQLYAYEAVQCYLNEFDILQQSYANQQITREEFSSHYAEIRKNMHKLGEYLGFMDKEINRTESEFKTAFNATQKSDNYPIKQTPEHGKISYRKTDMAKATSREKIRTIISQNRIRIEKAQTKNDDDLTHMLDDCAGKITPPKQNANVIRQEYTSSYVESKSQIEDLRSTHKAALEIMDKAAMEAGIDMV